MGCNVQQGPQHEGTAMRLRMREHEPGAVAAPDRPPARAPVIVDDVQVQRSWTVDRAAPPAGSVLEALDFAEQGSGGQRRGGAHHSIDIAGL